VADRSHKVLFTPKYVELIRQSRKLNEDKKIVGEIYFHPVETGNKIKIKTIDLNSDKPLCEVNSSKTGEQNWEEHWLEAYIINKSKENGWKFSTSNKTFRFLSSQLRFRKNDALKVKGRHHLVTDILLYDQLEDHLVIWELKSNAESTSLTEAMGELRVYCKELTRLFIDDNDETYNAKHAYGLERDGIRKVDGYVVLPSNDRNYETKPFGLYEYSCPGLVIDEGRLVKPWKHYKQSVDINFELKIEPK
jgi:hypothetical protein